MCVFNASIWDTQKTQFWPSRAFPRLAWAMPVDIVDLATTLEGYRIAEPKMDIIRLSHRFGSGILSKVPQEIIEVISAELQQLEGRDALPYWEQSFACFQGKCTAASHYYNQLDYDTETLWRAIFTETRGSNHLDIEQAGYTDKQKAEIIEEQLNGPIDSIGGRKLEYLHIDGGSEWLANTCLCDRNGGKQVKTELSLGECNQIYGSVSDFQLLNYILNTRFGLQIQVLHELLSYELQEFLPGFQCRDDWAFYSSAFLTLASGTHAPYGVTNREHDELSELYLPHGQHLAFRQVINPASLSLTEGQQLRFKKAINTLGLSPRYHLTEMQSLISPPSDDAAVWEICGKELEHCPKSSNIPVEKKVEKLEGYIEQKNDELSKQSWPQLMLISTSDAIESFF